MVRPERSPGGRTRRSRGDRWSLLGRGLLTPAPVSEVLAGFVAEVQLGEPEHLIIGQGINVDTDVGHDLCGDIGTMLFGIRHKMVGRIRPALSMPKEQNCCRRSERVAELLPVLLAVGLIRAARVARTVRHLVVVALWVICGDSLRSRA